MCDLDQTSPKRKAVSKRVRFEVFKRDAFTCQYCGMAAPDVILHVDHINPVAGGGGNDIMNLITSCQPCNAGKGDKTLDDKSAISKQRQQLKALNDRRDQLDMMLRWRDGLSSIEDDAVQSLCTSFEKATSHKVNEQGAALVKKWLKRHTISDLLSAMDSSLETYFKDGNPIDCDSNLGLASKAFDMIPRVASARKRYANKPWMKDLFYIRGIIRNRMYCGDRKAMELLETAARLGAHVDELQDWAKTARNWTNWRDEMEVWIVDLEGNQ